MERIVLLVFGGFALVLLVVMQVIDMAARVEWVDQHWPWLLRWAEHKGWHRVLLLVAMSLLAGDFWEIQKEPEITLQVPSVDPGAKDANIEQQQREIRQLNNKIEYLQKHQTIITKRQAAPVSSDSDELTRLRSQMDDKQRRKAIREHLAGFMNEGMVIKQECVSLATNDTDIETAANDWAKRTFTYLDGIEHSYSARFNGSQGPTYTTGVSSEAKNRVWNFVNLRLQTLSQLLQELRD